MEEKDKIKELFKSRLENFESPVDPKIWEGVESAIKSPGASSGVSTSSGVLSSTGKVVLGVIGITTAAVSLIAFSVLPPKEIQETDVELAKKQKVSHVNGILENENSTAKYSENKSEDQEKELLTEQKKSDHANLNEIKGEHGSQPKIQISEVVRPKEENKVDEKNSDNVVDVPNNQEELVEFMETDDTSIISKAPEKIVVKEQSRVEAYPTGGIAPLWVEFSSVSEVSDIKWKFDDGTESTEVNPNHEFKEPGIYVVTMLAKLTDGTIVMDKAVVQVKPDNQKTNDDLVENSEILVHNIITPNGDGINDVLKVNMKGIQSYSISIYSNSGELVFNTENPNNHWDGRKLDGSLVSDGTYYYLVNAIGQDEKIYAPKGFITVRGGQ